MFDIEMSAGGSTDIITEIKKYTDTIKDITSKRADVGIFSTHKERNDGKSNVKIGEAHEFGDPKHNLPKRSFLLKPIADGTLDSNIRKVDFTLDKDLLSRVATAYLDSVLEEFDTNGKGEWRPLSQETLHRKKQNLDKILTETEQLRHSLSKRFVGGKKDYAQMIASEFYMF